MTLAALHGEPLCLVGADPLRVDRDERRVGAEHALQVLCDPTVLAHGGLARLQCEELRERLAETEGRYLGPRVLGLFSARIERGLRLRARGELLPLTHAIDDHVEDV